MSHSFLVETGKWLLKGNWMEKNQEIITMDGSVEILWSEQNWFTMSILLNFPQNDREDILGKYRGHFNETAYQYTYVLKQNWLGRIEGEGWVGPQGIIQRYWVIGDRQRRGGFESFYQLSPNSYHLTGAIFSGHFINSTFEASLDRQS